VLTCFFFSQCIRSVGGLWDCEVGFDGVMVCGGAFGTERESCWMIVFGRVWIWGLDRCLVRYLAM
jgi:hypothetical protein